MGWSVSAQDPGKVQSHRLKVSWTSAFHIPDEPYRVRLTGRAYTCIGGIYLGRCPCSYYAGVVVVFLADIPKSYSPWFGDSVSSIKRLSLLYGSHVRFRGPQYSGVGEGSKPGDKRTDSNKAWWMEMRERGEG